MEKTKTTFARLNLILPNYFKKIGLALIVASVLMFALARIFDFPLDKETLKTIFYNLLIFSSLLIMISRDKVEDELTGQIKLMALFFAFGTGVMIFLFSSIPIFRDEFPEFLDTQSLLLFMFITFFVTKYTMSKQSENDEPD